MALTNISAEMAPVLISAGSVMGVETAEMAMMNLIVVSTQVENHRCYS